MSLLAQVRKGPAIKPRRVLIYGTQGIGKSTFAAHAPDPIFLPTEEGIDDLNVHSFPKLTDYDSLVEALSELCNEGHDYKTVVIDSLDALEHLVWDKTCRNEGKDNIEDFGYGKGYTKCLDQWREILSGLDFLRDNRGMTVVLIGHSKIERFENPETEAYDRYSPRLHKHAAALVQEWSDEVLFATYEVRVRKEKGKFNNERAIAKGGDRILRTVEQPSHVAKNRLSLPEVLPLSWDAFAEFLPKPSSNGAMKGV